MVKAVWNGVTIAESHDTVVVEGNHYFPRDSVNAAWYYPDPKPAAVEVRDRIAFWKGVQVG